MLRNLRQRLTFTDLAVWGIGLAIAATVVWGSTVTLIAGKYTAVNYFDLAASGLALGSVYAIIAVGYTMVYGVLRMINFAHSEVFMSGPFTAVFVAKALDASGFLDRQPVISLLLITLVSASMSCLIAILVERVAYRPLRGAPRLVPLITAIGASFFLQYTFRGLYGSGFQAYPTIGVLAGSMSLGPVRVFKTQILVIVSAVVLMATLYWIVRKTKMGKAMQAVSEDKEVAALMGIDVDRVIVFTFALGGAAAGVAGVMYALMFPAGIWFFMGFFPGLKAFTSAVLGGIGNVPGAFLGALVLGIVESVGPTLFLDGLGIPAPYQLKDMIAFTILVFILIVRPTGILGERLAVAKA